MSRKRKQRRHRSTKGRSARAVQVQPKTVVSPLQQLLDRADDDPDLDRALEAYQTALDECQHAAAVSTFENANGRLWDNPGARCYVRAVFGTGTSLWRLSCVEDATGQFREVLQLDEADHLRARYWLAACLLDSGQFEELERLLDRYDDRTAVWRYARALWAFATRGDCDESCRLLRHARSRDAAFVDYLFGVRMVRSGQAIHFEPRKKNTHDTARLLLPAWRTVPGAVTWARRVLGTPLDRAETALPMPREQLLELPREDTSWQLDVLQLNPNHPEESPCWVLGVADAERDELRCLTMIDGDPTPATVWREMLSAFLQPATGTPRRPRQLEVPCTEYRRAWRRSLREFDVECRVTYQPQLIGQLLQRVAEGVAAQSVPPLADAFDPCDLPLGDATWQIDFFHQPMSASSQAIGGRRPWSVLVVDKESGIVLCSEMIQGEPTAERLWEHAVEVMRQLSGRPRRIEVSDSNGYDFLRRKLTAAKVECVLLDELPALDAIRLDAVKCAGGPEPCALADGRGVDRDGMESFYHAADRYFRQAPWKLVPGEIPIEVNVAGYPTRYAIVLGRTGVTLGLCVHDDMDDVSRIVNGGAGGLAWPSCLTSRRT